MDDPKSQPSVLIVGAGPSGLALALWLTKIGVKVRLIDKSPSTLGTSRAIVVHARTLEFYRQLGIADEMVSRGFPFPALNLWVKAKSRARFSLGLAGQGLSPYPFVLIFPQDEHEKLLTEHLKKHGVEIEWNTELLSLEQRAAEVKAWIRSSTTGAVEETTFPYLAGCDGAHSKVREQLGIGFEGSTFPGMFYVADISGEGPVLNGELHVSLDKTDFLAIFPLKEKGHARLIGSVKDRDQDAKFDWSDVHPRILSEMRIHLRDVRWFSAYHIHHRVASRFQKGRVFLLGDAGHIHSPVGGQGMNTGIGDAVNLAWKLGDVIKGKADPALLETYEIERMRFARQLVSTTDRAFHLISSPGRLARFVRTAVVPVVLPLLFRFRFFQRAAYRLVSQIRITYRKNPAARGVQKGDRLPWIEGIDNFAPLRSLDWQIHVYGDRDEILRKETLPGLAIHIFPWTEETARKGLQRNQAYLIRPDGHIGSIKSPVRERKSLPDRAVCERFYCMEAIWFKSAMCFSWRGISLFRMTSRSSAPSSSS